MKISELETLIDQRTKKSIDEATASIKAEMGNITNVADEKKFNEAVEKAVGKALEENKKALEENGNMLLNFEKANAENSVKGLKKETPTTVVNEMIGSYLKAMNEKNAMNVKQVTPDEALASAKKLYPNSKALHAVLSQKTLTVSVPADGEHVLTIGAVGTDGERAYFSSIGPTYDGRIKPDVMAHGYGTTVASPGEGAYYDGSGTSYACPVLAGMATCLWQANKHMKAAEIRDAIRQSGNMSTPDNYYGYGIPNFVEALNALFLEEKSDFVINSLISIYPNPSNGVVEVKLEIEGKADVKVYNQIGKLLYNNTIMSDSANGLDAFLSNIGEGVYFINVVGDEKNITSKFIKY